MSDRCGKAALALRYGSAQKNSPALGASFTTQKNLSTSRTFSFNLRDVYQTYIFREKFTCRDCEKISQAPAPFHVIARGWAGPSLLAMILFEKFGQHQPLNRQAERYAKEGVPIETGCQACSSSSNVLASFRSSVSKPSVNQP